MSDLTLSNQADRRLQIMRNGVMGMVRWYIRDGEGCDSSNSFELLKPPNPPPT